MIWLKKGYDDNIKIRKNLYEKLEEQKIHIIITQDTTDQFVKIVRNDIAHEYHTEKLNDIFKKVLELTPYLLNCVEDVREYCNKRNYI